MDIFKAVKSLVVYAENNGLCEKRDEAFLINRILECLRLDFYEDRGAYDEKSLYELLNEILDYACENGLCEDSVTFRDLFSAKLMGLLMPRPSEVTRHFYEEYEKSPEAATDYFYSLAKTSDYIREYRIKNDVKWVTKTEYGDIDITINLSKPEKDPRAIAAARNSHEKKYPQCMLCPENEGFEGSLTHPARQNHRIIPVELDGAEWFFQYSPYVYYNEHCIVLSKAHSPMTINESTFRKLFAFVKAFPHYFVGSNADLPIVGGSILTHEHFQGGNYTFAMAKASIEEALEFKGFSDIEAGIVKWPMSVIRLRGESADRLTELSALILKKWRSYTDEEAFIFSKTDGIDHNTITPIARFKNGKLEIDLVLRNNITTKELPDGVYHPHPELHHLKKENIGLIEVMGLAVLPSRLKSEMAELKKAMLTGEPFENNEKTAKHAEWARKILEKTSVTEENCDAVLEEEIGKAFTTILEQCGVFKRTEEGRRFFKRFTDSI